MADWPLRGGQLIETVGADLSNSRGTTVAASATANTKGSWTQIIAATAFDAHAVFLNPRGPNTAAAAYLLDIGIGAASSEWVLVPNLVLGSMTGTVGKHGGLLLPLHVPRGSRIAARVQSSTASAQVRVSMQLMAAGWMEGPGLQRVLDYGAVTSTSEGTQIDPGGTIHTKGSWVQLVASTTNPIRAFFVGVSSLKNAAQTSQVVLLDVGIGAASSERAVLENLAIEVSSTDDTFVPCLAGPFFAEIPSGSRIAVRAQSQINEATDRLFGAIVYGIG